MTTITLNFSDSETPERSGDLLILTHSPSPPASLQVFRNGLLQDPDGDYVATGFFVKATPSPTNDDQFRCFYRF